MYISTLSRLTGVSRKAIQHYESIGLMPVPKRMGRYRVYGDADADLIRMIKRAQFLGFSLKEIAGLALTRAKVRQCPTEMVLELIKAKRGELQNLIDKVNLQDRQLAELQADLLNASSSR